MELSQQLLDEIISEQSVVALGLVTPEGLPHTTPIWIATKNKKFYMFSRSSRAKCRYASQNPEAMIAFQWASMRGTIRVLHRGSKDFESVKDVMDDRYGGESGYEEYKKNWDVALEFTPYKIFR
ncbi:MAG: pyridoxamine 5'-phosphate oxidase family protein [Candidatus Heimdallarchaeota archaeon]|nr:pyridoxamine 5'-phosphate oxidase family protein [Candidatus Heimdallarchaeota archaeon]